MIALDFATWLQHVMFHAVPALWHLHRVHHADLDGDVTTGPRFHPVEILLRLSRAAHGDLASGLLALPFRGRVTGYAINRRQWQDGND